MNNPNIEMRCPSTLTPYSGNAKQHPTEQIDAIASSISTYGFNSPLVINSQGIVLSGHGRLEAARRLGLKQIPVVIKDDLSPAAQRGYRIADNKVAQSGFDNDLLVQELQELSELDFDLSLTGFDQDELDSLLESDDFEFQGKQVFGDEDDESDADDDYDEPPASSVRMMQLFLSTETYPKFMEMIESLNVVYGTDNPTDCVMAVLQADYERNQA